MDCCCPELLSYELYEVSATPLLCLSVLLLDCTKPPGPLQHQHALISCPSSTYPRFTSQQGMPLWIL